ncbi:unnamed protein product [Symbiodinium natans]|uniref:Uncharacterized protein n=1 Tax=Symbiodinium natans TaxID=878477 RepID=A0A812U8R1_9DINO|nr:unnamed protein product [Symbiodinium natans]CAE7601489.1 unnamed protein product [Symbiodinium natans]
MLWLFNLFSRPTARDGAMSNRADAFSRSGDAAVPPAPAGPASSVPAESGSQGSAAADLRVRDSARQAELLHCWRSICEHSMEDAARALNFWTSAPSSSLRKSPAMWSWTESESDHVMEEAAPQPASADPQATSPPPAQAPTNPAELLRERQWHSSTSHGVHTDPLQRVEPRPLRHEHLRFDPAIGHRAVAPDDSATSQRSDRSRLPVVCPTAPTDPRPDEMLNFEMGYTESLRTSSACIRTRFPAGSIRVCSRPQTCTGMEQCLGTGNGEGGAEVRTKEGLKPGEEV